MSPACAADGGALIQQSSSSSTDTNECGKSH
jgi:hypothetical protein